MKVPDSVLSLCGLATLTITPDGRNCITLDPRVKKEDFDRFPDAFKVVQRWVSEFRSAGMGDLLAPAPEGSHWQNIYLLTHCQTPEIDRICHHILMGELVAIAPHDYLIQVEVPDHTLPPVSDEALEEDRRVLDAAVKLLGLPRFMTGRL